MSKNRDIAVDDTFGRLTVRSLLTRGKVACVCECGKELHVFRSYLLSGARTSCGCSREIAAHWEKTEYAKDYARWHNGRARGRFCPEWTETFEAFLAGVKSLPNYGKGTLRRPDTSKPFGPDNAQWSGKVTVEEKTTPSVPWVGDTVYIAHGGLAYSTRIDSITLSADSSGQRVRITAGSDTFEGPVPHGWGVVAHAIELPGRLSTLCFTKDAARSVSERKVTAQHNVLVITARPLHLPEGPVSKALAESLALTRKLMEEAGLL